MRYAERLGVGSLPSVPSLALGSGEVTLLSMTSAFSAFANQGMLFAPILIRRVETTDGVAALRQNASQHRTDITLVSGHENP